MQQQGLVPNAITYTAPIAASEKGKTPDRALELFDIMRQQGLALDVIMHSAAISVCEKGAKPQRAL